MPFDSEAAPARYIPTAPAEKGGRGGKAQEEGSV